MKLKYTGPKELISAFGISFKKGKDDKYVYIYPAFQIYNAIHHDYEKDIVYTHNIEGKRLNDEELLLKLLSLEENLKNKIAQEIIEIEKYLDNEIKESEERTDLNIEERRVYKNNLIIMKNYRVQRQTNKIVYKELIGILVDDIFKNKLKEINAPFNERFWHVFQTIQGELSSHDKRSIGSTLDIVHQENSITISLKINSIGK